jgi:hypothetical protein
MRIIIIDNLTFLTRVETAACSTCNLEALILKTEKHSKYESNYNFDYQSFN